MYMQVAAARKTRALETDMLREKVALPIREHKKLWHSTTPLPGCGLSVCSASAVSKSGPIDEGVLHSSGVWLQRRRRQKRRDPTWPITVSSVRWSRCVFHSSAVHHTCISCLCCAGGVAHENGCRCHAWQDHQQSQGVFFVMCICFLWSMRCAYGSITNHQHATYERHISCLHCFTFSAAGFCHLFLASPPHTPAALNARPISTPT